MNIKKGNNRGMSLVELLVALAILAMLMTAVIMMMSNNTVVYRKTKADINVQTTAQETYNALQDSIMQAKDIFISGYEGENKGSVVTYMKDVYVDWKTDKKKNGSDLTAKEKAEIEATMSASTKTLIQEEEGTVKRFSDLKQADGKTVQIHPTKISIRYSVKETAEIDNGNCFVTYYFCRYTEQDHSKCNVYVTRQYDSSVGKDNDVWDAPASEGAWTPASTDDSTADDRKPYENSLFTSSLSEATIGLDYESQSVDMTLDFFDKNRVYNTSGIVGIRNSYVTNTLRNRTELGGTVTTTSTSGGTDDSGLSTEDGTKTGN